MSIRLLPIYAIDYRLAPEHPYPAALEDALAAYRASLAQGLDPNGIAVVADSAGANLTLALKLKTLGLPQPSALVCMSPATDLAEQSAFFMESTSPNERELFLLMARTYCISAEPNDPLISPLRGDVAGLPPTLIQCAEPEALRDDSVRMAEKLRAAGVPVALERWPKVFHVWQALADILPESRKAIDSIVDSWARSGSRLGALPRRAMRRDTSPRRWYRARE